MPAIKNKTLGAFTRYRFNANSAGPGEPDFAKFLWEMFLKELEESVVRFRAFFKLDAGINIFRVLTEDNHVNLFGVLHR